MPTRLNDALFGSPISASTAFFDPPTGRTITHDQLHPLAHRLCNTAFADQGLTVGRRRGGAQSANPRCANGF